MKRLLPILLCCALLWGCGAKDAKDSAIPTDDIPVTYPAVTQPVYEEIPYTSRFDTETRILLSDNGITVDGGGETGAVYCTNDIIYYEDRDVYDSGNPYGEGTDADKHTAQEAAAHTVVNITQPGAYRISGALSAGQIRIDLGSEAYSDKNAVVELILADASITCGVAPAILFLNTYECDGNWSPDTATAQVDTSAAGANLILEGHNTVTGSYVAKIFKDKEGEKKLYKQDGALYSYMSMNVYGPGSLDLTAENEGLDSELHLTINGGSINIRSDNDGINTNEDGVSVTTINAGTLHIIAGLGAEGDGIDSNGYLVINGGTVVAAANPAADAGLDSDLGSYINGGIVAAFGSTMDWAESDSKQVTVNLQFAQQQPSNASLLLAYPDGTPVFAYDPGQDEILGENVRQYMGAIVSSPNLQMGQSYELYLSSTITGTETGGIYNIPSVTGFTGGSQMAYTGTDVGGFRGMGGPRPGNMDGDFPGELPDGMKLPENFDPNAMPNRPDGMNPMEKPDWNNGQMPEGMEPPEGMAKPDRMDGNRQTDSNAGDKQTLFYLTDQVNAFSGITTAN